ncbi:MAG: DUF456 family protein [Planctomycetes bacterium]|nr:DUF456 family protein [Planctomycetota bacterium]
MYIVYAIILLSFNAMSLLLVVLGLPGNWLMVLATGVFAWAMWDVHAITAIPLAAIGLLALVGEILETTLGASGARKAGGSRWGAIGAILGALVGGIAGTFVIPIPVVGSILGACIGAGVGAIGFELAGGQKLGVSLRTGKGAAVGRLYGTIAKLVVGVTIWLIVAAALFIP